jgi:hypothetical protein
MLSSLFETCLPLLISVLPCSLGNLASNSRELLQGSELDCFGRMPTLADNKKMVSLRRVCPDMHPEVLETSNA